MDIRARLSSEDGFGLIELLMAIVMLNIGILAIVATFDSGAVALRRASHISTASALADQQMGDTGRSSTPRSGSTRRR